MKRLAPFAVALAACQHQGASTLKASGPVAGAASEEAQAEAELAAAGFTKAEVKAAFDTLATARALAAGQAKGARASHAKALACLKASLAVDAKDGAGFFKEPKTYQALVRISNGGAERDDRARIIERGWAVKVLDAPQDFLLSTAPDFYIEDLTHYPAFLAATGEGRSGFAGNTLVGMSFAERKVVARHLVQRVPDMLAAPLYSVTPYKYGRAVVKYALAPCGQTPPTYPKSLAPPPTAGPDYLAQGIAATLKSAQKGVCYGFFIQRQRRPDQDSIEALAHEWTGPFEKVGELRLQSPPEPAAACEELAFDPWTAAADNAPLGKVNWLRRYVYRALARERGAKVAGP